MRQPAGNAFGQAQEEASGSGGRIEGEPADVVNAYGNSRQEGG